MAENAKSEAKTNFETYAGRVATNPADGAGSGNAGDFKIAGRTRDIQVVMTTRDADSLARVLVVNEAAKSKEGTITPAEAKKAMGKKFDEMTASGNPNDNLQTAIKDGLAEFAARDAMGGVKEKYKISTDQAKAMGDVAKDFAATVATAKTNATNLDKVVDKLPDTKITPAIAQEINILLGKDAALADEFSKADNAEKAKAAMKKAAEKLPADKKVGLEVAMALPATGLNLAMSDGMGTGSIPGAKGGLARS